MRTPFGRRLSRSPLRPHEAAEVVIRHSRIPSAPDGDAHDRLGRAGAITYGIPLSGTQLDATASSIVDGTSTSVAGTFSYTPATGTVLPAGAGQTLSVTFTPTDTTDYTTATQTTTINVNAATPTISWATPAPITYGTPLPSALLDAAASGPGNTPGNMVSVPGSFVYTPAAGTVLLPAIKLFWQLSRPRIPQPTPRPRTR